MKITRENWKSKEKLIVDYIRERQDKYENSSIYSRLKTRKQILRNSIDMVHANNTFRSKLYLPLTRMRARTMRAIMRANYGKPPVFMVTPVGATPKESAIYMQKMLEQNLRETEYKTKCHEKILGMGADYGTAITYSYFQINSKPLPRTVFDPAVGYKRDLSVVTTKNVVNKAIDMLDFGTDPRCFDPSESTYNYHKDKKPLAALVAELNNPDSRFDKANLKKVVSKAKEGAIEESGNKDMDFDRYNMNNCLYWYGQLHIKGNEGDDTEYFVVLIDDTIVRFEVTYLDYNIRPYSIFRCDPKLDTWYSSGVADIGVSFNEFLNIIWNTSAENAMNSLQQYIFYNKSVFPNFNPADLNERRRNGGFIGAEGISPNQSMSYALQAFQPIDNSLQGTNNMTAEIKEWNQRSMVDVDMQRSQQQGGLNNKTATAASIVDQYANIMQNDILEPFSYGFVDMGKKNMILLQQFADSEIELRDKNFNSINKIQKREIFGQYDVDVHSSYKRNQESELMRLNNVLTMLLNAKASQEPEMGAIKLRGIIKELLRQADLPGDEDEYYDENSMMQQQGMPPQMGGAIPQAGMAPPPAAQPETVGAI